MSDTKRKAEEIITAIENGTPVNFIKDSLCTDDSEWYRYSSSAYNIYLERGKKKRKEDELKHNVGVTSNKQVQEILDVNNTLSEYALLMSIFSTIADLNHIKDLIPQLPSSESELITAIGNITMQPQLRVRQKKGRFEKFEHFKVFTKLIDAATLSYYRTNFISCYLTLLPIIEGIIIRWMGYSEGEEKPEFEKIKKFFKTSYLRQPCPSNILFHNVYIKGCDKILNEHFYKHTSEGKSYANFNRHVASHILNDNQFATKENCIRLFILLDAMTEIYLYESRTPDPRFILTSQEISEEIEIFINIIINNLYKSAEHTILGTNPSDILKLVKDIRDIKL